MHQFLDLCFAEGKPGILRNFPPKRLPCQRTRIECEPVSPIKTVEPVGRQPGQTHQGRMRRRVRRAAQYHSIVQNHCAQH